MGERTTRRAWQRLGYRWQRPRCVLGRPDPACAETQRAVIAHAQALIAAGGAVWVADETARREVPPLRAGGSRRAQPATVLSSGTHPRRPILAALPVGTRELVTPGRGPARGATRRTGW